MKEFTIVFDETAPWTSWKRARAYCVDELGTDYYAINSDLKQTKVKLLALEKGLTAKAWTGLNYDGSKWLWSDGSKSLGYSNWLTVPTDPDTFSKVALSFDKNAPNFGKWKAQRPGSDANILVCKKEEETVCCENSQKTQNMRIDDLEYNVDTLIWMLGNTIPL